ncbi:MAG TPA: Uma2 family endonuclease [Terracidiphilus sp.]|jgi:Uma2 family endonuclease
MATALHIPLKDYLRQSFRPDREYVDGEIRERNVGKYEHARVQALLAAWFNQHENEWGVQVVTEQRVRVSPNRVRIPDVALLPAGPQPDVISDPPALVIEILSPEDSYSDTQERASDYRAMGVQTVWIIDPKTRTGRMCSGADWIESPRLAVKGTPLYVDLADIFSKLTPA